MTRELKNNEIIEVFLDSYKKKYSIDFKRSYARDNKFTTQFKKTVTDLKNNEIKRLVEIIVENYESWSSNTAKYPLTIRTLSIEWVQSKARKILEEEKNKTSQVKKQSVEATKRTEQSISAIMARFSKGGE